MAEAGSIGTRPLRFSLQAKIVLLVLLCVGIPLFSMGLYGLRLNRELLQDKVHENLTNQLFRKSTALDDWVKQALGDVRQWSTTKYVLEGAQSLAGKQARRSEPGARTRHERVPDPRDGLLPHLRFAVPREPRRRR